ncbi:MAG: alpha/beta fold hydrolase [Candidatus Lokiarchaeota archaeon]|nr:alpha/beta fold hydrolase [Candidatus Lokiarchaeota archaeon]
MPYFKYEKKKIYYQDEGKARQNNANLIFIHGAGENSNTWWFQTQKLSKYFRTIALDLPNHAKSEKFEELYMNLFLQVINKLINHLRLDSVILIGHSMGGAISMSYLLEFYEVDALILIGTGAKLKVNPLIIEVLTKNFKLALEQIDSIAIYSKSKSKQKLDEIKDFLRQEALKTPPETHINDFQICNQFDIMDKLNEIEVPTLIICGERDLLTPIKYSDYLHKKIKNSILYKVPETSHCVYIEQADLVNEKIKEFINSIKK